ncbi:MAG TPA: hypothetical protein VNK04_15070 [Gemmataceae bacterium]|nr:hypothetical protein [Gemmataceae bacterium]
MIMRRVFWCIAAAALTAALGIYLAADQASRHPDSFLGQSVIAFYRSAVQYNPVFAFQAARTAFRATPTAACTPAGCCADDEPPCAAPDLSQCRLPGRIVLQEEDCQTSFTPDSAPTEEEIQLTGALVELVPPPTIMDAADEIPACIEPADFILPAGDEPDRIMPRADDDGAPAVMPYADEDETKETDNDLIHFLNQCLRALVASDDCEKSEFPSGGQPPDCREDPNRHLQYPGCPYVCPHSRNYCPYSGRSVVPENVCPPLDRDVPPAPDRLEKKPASPTKPRNIPQEAEESEVRPRHPEVDTMEFRPTEDAKPGEFGLIPF